MARHAPLSRETLDDRARFFLKVLVERYIQDGQPVGSRTLARDAGSDLSPATVRNVMADLEELGLVTSPHTSAGRIPTEEGYRFFVDSLITVRPLGDPEIQSLKEQLTKARESGRLAESVSQVLSGVTHMAGVVMLPRRERVAFRQIEFLRLSGTRILAILVTSGGEVLNRIIQTEREFSASELEQSANYLNQTYGGRTLQDMRARLLKEMREVRRRMDGLMAFAVEMGSEVLRDEDALDDCFISGQTNLMDFNDFSDLRRLRELFDAFTRKHDILYLLDACVRAEGMQIFIGRESGYEHLDRCSLITAPYAVEDEVVGVLGVIGPTRMAYDRIIPIVDVTARLVGAALKQG
ncbi:MAG: heat-inducible transcriptional repressor HrcA [Chromatiales bacterium]